MKIALTGWALCYISTVFISIPQNSTHSIYKCQVSIDLRSYFEQIIGHNFSDSTKLVPKFALMSPLCVPSFSLIRVRAYILWPVS